MSAAKRKRRSHGRARAAARRARASAAIRSGGPLGLRLRAARSLLLIVDVQEKLAPAIPNAREVLGNCALLLKAAARLGVPALISAHCPQQLGPIVADLRGGVGEDDIVAKVQFSCADEPALMHRIAAHARQQIVIAGMEAHVCVLQSALGLAERGYRCCVVGDATGSRAAGSHALAMDRLRQAQIPVVSAEMVVFEWLERADRPELRDLLALIRD